MKNSNNPNWERTVQGAVGYLIDEEKSVDNRTAELMADFHLQQMKYIKSIDNMVNHAIFDTRVGMFMEKNNIHEWFYFHDLDGNEIGMGALLQKWEDFKESLNKDEQ